MTDTVKEWGPEIKVDGKRPEWLTSEQMVDPKWGGDEWYSDGNFRHRAGGARSDCVADWPNVTAIRLPANHPYYATVKATPDTLADRMKALVRRMAVLGDIKAPETPPLAWVAEARDIVAELPAVVDPDEAEATEISRQWCNVHQPAILAAIKRGRALAAEGK